MGQTQFRCCGGLISDTFYPLRGNTPARTNEETHGANSSRSSASASNARLLFIVSSKVAAINIYDEFGKTDAASSYQVVAKIATCVSQYIEQTK